ncbi:hypothetical protein FSP39_024821, partial [Pinctada imbricata]
DIEETFTERLIGLTEMFPESLRNFMGTVTTYAWKTTKWTYGFSQSALWIMTTAATIAVLPVMLENERSQMVEQQKQQERQILLGPHAAVSGQQGMFPGMMPQSPPGMAPPPPPS